MVGGRSPLLPLMGDRSDPPLQKSLTSTNFRSTNAIFYRLAIRSWASITRSLCYSCATCSVHFRATQIVWQGRLWGCLFKHLVFLYSSCCSCSFSPFYYFVSSYMTQIIMVAVCNRADHYIFILFLSSFFFSSSNLSGWRLDVYHTSTHGVALVRI